MVDGLGIHRANEADVVRDAGNVGKELGDFVAGFPVFLEFVFGAGDGEGLLSGGHAGFPLVQFDEFAEFLTVVFLEFGFVVEKVLGGGGTALEEVDHALRFGCGLGDWFGSKIVAEHGSEGGDADARG